MKSKLLAQANGSRTFILVFEVGEEALAGLKSFATENKLRGSQFTALGAFQDVTVGWMNPETGNYEPIHLAEQVELLSLIGNVASSPDGGITVHAHAVVGRRDGHAFGGHLLEAHVRPTLEVTITESPEHLQRRRDARTGMALISP